jgi:hypothetical protein
LTTLKINVKTFDDCLYLLDGRFNCLSMLVIEVESIADTLGTSDNTVSILLNSCVSKKNTTVNLRIKHALFVFLIEKTCPIETLLINIAWTHTFI